MGLSPRTIGTGLQPATLSRWPSKICSWVWIWTLVPWSVQHHWEHKRPLSIILKASLPFPPPQWSTRFLLGKPRSGTCRKRALSHWRFPASGTQIHTFVAYHLGTERLPRCRITFCLPGSLLSAYAEWFALHLHDVDEKETEENEVEWSISKQPCLPFQKGSK